MARRTMFCVLLPGVVTVATGSAQTQGCDVPDGMKKSQKLPCVHASSILLDQPALTATQLAKRPRL